jgi:hypothetical protein
VLRTMTTRIEQLSATIKVNTFVISNHLQQNGLPQPSFEVNGPIKLDLSPQLECARGATIDALQELLDLLQGPVACMLPKVSIMKSAKKCTESRQYNGTSLQVISRHDIARKVPRQGTISFTELAQATELHVNDLKRILRFAMSFHRLFQEPTEGFVAHSAGSMKLASDDLVRAGVNQSFNDFYNSFARVRINPTHSDHS